MDLRGVLDQFPPVEAAFAYGSGVFKQPKLYDANSQDKPMLDFVFVVEHAHDWHLEVRNQRTNGTCHAILLPPLLYLTGVANTESLQVHSLHSAVAYICSCSQCTLIHFLDLYDTLQVDLMQNMVANRHHYSGMAWYGPHMVSRSM